jgi:hypothetical protein
LLKGVSLAFSSFNSLFQLLFFFFQLIIDQLLDLFLLFLLLDNDKIKVSFQV